MISKDELLELADHVIDRLQNKPEQAAVLALTNPQDDPAEVLRLKAALHLLRSLYKADWSNGVEFSSGWEEFWSSLDDPEWEKYFSTMDQLRTRVANMQGRLRELLHQAQDGKDVDEIIQSLDKPVEEKVEKSLDGFDEKFLVQLGMLDGISPEYRRAVENVQISMELDDLKRAWSNLDRYVDALQEETAKFLDLLRRAEARGIEVKDIMTSVMFPKTAEGVPYPSPANIGSKADSNRLLSRVLICAFSPDVGLSIEDLREAESILGTIVPKVSSVPWSSGQPENSPLYRASHPDFTVVGEGQTPEEAVDDFRQKL